MRISSGARGIDNFPSLSAKSQNLQDFGAVEIVFFDVEVSVKKQTEIAVFWFFPQNGREMQIATLERDRRQPQTPWERRTK